MGYNRYMNYEKKIKFPLLIDTDVDFGDLNFFENFNIKYIKQKIDLGPKEIFMRGNKKNKSKKLL